MAGCRAALVGMNLVLPILGVSVEFEAAEPELLDAVDAVYGQWRRLAADDGLVSPAGSGPSPLIRLRPEGSATVAPEQLSIETRDGRLTAEAAGVRAVASLDGMHAEARIAPAIVSSRRALRLVLDTLVLQLVTRLDREPVHAAVLATNGRGLVLAGPSGVGKSTLSYAAHREGFRVITDNSAYVQLNPGLRVWGMPGPVHLSPSVATWFPEIADEPIVRRPSGALKHAVELDRPAASVLGGGTDPEERPMVQQTALCVLERVEDDAAGQSVVALEPEKAVALLLSRLEPGFDAFRGSIAPRLSALAEGGAWLARVGGDPRATFAALAETAFPS